MAFDRSMKSLVKPKGFCQGSLRKRAFDEKLGETQGFLTKEVSGKRVFDEKLVESLGF